MKKILTLLAIVSISPVFGQNVVTFRPSGGANNGTDEGGLNSGKDTWAVRGAPTDNYGSTEITSASPRSTCNQSDYKSYYQFNLSTLPAVVDSVFFGVKHFEHTVSCFSNCDADFYFYYVTSSWDEMALTHSNEPTEDATPFFGPLNITFPNDFQSQEYEITSAYNQWKTGGLTNLGFTIYSPTQGCNNASVSFYIHSSDDIDSNNRPYLKVYYPDPSIGINELSMKTTVYPNPIKDELKIDTEQLQSYSFTDLLGRKFAVDFEPVSKTFNTTNLGAGVYLLQIYLNDGKHETIRLVKE